MSYFGWCILVYLAIGLATGAYLDPGLIFFQTVFFWPLIWWFNFWDWRKRKL